MTHPVPQFSVEPRLGEPQIVTYRVDGPVGRRRYLVCGHAGKVAISTTSANNIFPGEGVWRAVQVQQLY
jgi:hypothetical protein